jgi:uncharacterized membrane protein YraQ (UPF0718 family)
MDMDVLNLALRMLQSGLANLAAYLAAHVLLCLVPAFFMAGALSALVPKEAVTRYLGRTAPKLISYPAAALGGFVLAVCSCTVMPLFSGIYRKGAGLGPAVTFLFVGPAINILALTYSGVALGADIAVARLALSMLFGIGIGLIMATVFRRSDAQRDAAVDPFAARATVSGRVWLFLGLLLALLLAGTLQVGLLTEPFLRLHAPVPGAEGFQALLNQWAPYDATRGEEGVSIQGLVLIGLLGLIAASGVRGFGRVDQGFNRWTQAALGLVGLTLFVASLRLPAAPGGIDIQLSGRSIAVGALLFALYRVGRGFEDYEIQEWLFETWRFVRQIFPLLVAGVFIIGALRPLIRPEWIESLAGENTLRANVVAVLFGVVMYFPTLVEVPIARLFLDLGMHRGPLLAYLMADPELSLQSILITSKIMGRRKALVYVGLVAVFSVSAGLLFGAWVDGANGWLIAGGSAAALALLAIVLRLVILRSDARRHSISQVSKA